MSEEKADGWSCLMPFWIDTDAYTDRDRFMFVCGYEFGAIYGKLCRGEGFDGVIHTENSSRIRMMCGRMKIPAPEIKQMEEPYGTYSECRIQATGEEWPPTK